MLGRTKHVTQRDATFDSRSPIDRLSQCMSVFQCSYPHRGVSPHRQLGTIQTSWRGIAWYFAPCFPTDGQKLSKWCHNLNNWMETCAERQPPLCSMHKGVCSRLVEHMGAKELQAMESSKGGAGQLEPGHPESKVSFQVFSRNPRSDMPMSIFRVQERVVNNFQGRERV